MQIQNKKPPLHKYFDLGWPYFEQMRKICGKQQPLGLHLADPNFRVSGPSTSAPPVDDDGEDEDEDEDATADADVDAMSAYSASIHHRAHQARVVASEVSSSPTASLSTNVSARQSVASLSSIASATSLGKRASALVDGKKSKKPRRVAEPYVNLDTGTAALESLEKINTLVGSLSTASTSSSAPRSAHNAMLKSPDYALRVRLSEVLMAVPLTVLTIIERAEFALYLTERPDLASLVCGAAEDPVYLDAICNRLIKRAREQGAISAVDSNTDTFT